MIYRIRFSGIHRKFVCPRSSSVSTSVLAILALSWSLETETNSGSYISYHTVWLSSNQQSLYLSIYLQEGAWSWLTWYYSIDTYYNKPIRSETQQQNRPKSKADPHWRVVLSGPFTGPMACSARHIKVAIDHWSDAPGVWPQEQGPEGHRMSYSWKQWYTIFSSL